MLELMRPWNSHSMTVIKWSFLLDSGYGYTPPEWTHQLYYLAMGFV